MFYIIASLLIFNYIYIFLIRFEISSIEVESEVARMVWNDAFFLLIAELLAFKQMLYGVNHTFLDIICLYRVASKCMIICHHFSTM